MNAVNADGSAVVPPPEPPATYDEAEARGMSLFRAGDPERAVRMFELAKTLPGAGNDIRYSKQGGMQGSQGNPREPQAYRFATDQQKLIADYNIACCYVAMGDNIRAIGLLRNYAGSMQNPVNEINQMLVDDELVPLREELCELRKEYKKDDGLFALPDPGRIWLDICDKLGVEWNR